MKSIILTVAVSLLTGTICAQNMNCQQAVQVCNEDNLTGASNGYGSQEMPNNNTTDGCLTVEHQSSWYYFQAATSGTIEFKIHTGEDYDFAVWTGGCSNLGSPVRCSSASGHGATGLRQNSSDEVEGTNGDKWVAPLDVTAGKTYIMMVDNFSASTTSFMISWEFNDGATLNCQAVALPIELTAFQAVHDPQKEVNYIVWQTATEHDNDYFTLERSDDGMDWTAISTQDGANNSEAYRDYSYTDMGYKNGRVNYYRLTQTNMDGERKTYDMVSVDNSYDRRKVVTVMNLVGQKVPDDTKGMVIVMYEDGVTQRLFRP